MEKSKELIEKLKDPRYYLETLVKIKGKTPGLIPFILKPAQLDLFNTLAEHDRIILLKARQLGMSSAMTGWFYHKVITTPGINVALIGYNSDLTAELLDKVKTFYRTTPDELKPTIHYNSKYEISFPRMDSKILVLPSTETVGRGYTLWGTLATEVSFWEKAEEKMTILEASVPIEGKIVIESTPNQVGGAYYRRWMGDDNDYVKKEYGWWWEYSADQVKTIERRMNNPRKFAQEFGLQFNSSGRPVFDFDVIQAARKHQLSVGDKISEDSDEVVKIENDLRIYRQPEKDGMYIIGCLPDGERVITGNGLKNIEDVNLQDLLYNKSGELVSIKNIQRRYYSGEIIEILPHYTTLSTKFTPEHPVLILKDNKLYRRNKNEGGERYYKKEILFKKVGELSNSDILVYPIKYKNRLSDQEIITHFPTQDHIRIDRRIDPLVLLREEFWFFIGLWLAEGWAREDKLGHNSIVLHLNGYTETALAKRIRLYCKNLFNRSLNISNRRKNVLDLTFSCETIYKFIIENFGHGAKNKFIKEWIKCLPEHLKLAMFNGYRTGDGCVTNTKSGKSIVCVSISERLLFDFQEVLLSLGIISSINKLRNAGNKKIANNRWSYCQKTFSLILSSRESLKILNNEFNFVRKRHKRYGWIDDNYFYIKINQIKKYNYNGYVNNFETTSHNYAVPFIMTHNCDVAEGVEGGNHSVAVVLHRKTGEEVAFYQGHIAPDKFGQKLNEWGRRYNNALMVVEINNHGLTTVTILKQLLYPSMYFRPSKLETLGITSTDKMGWKTTKVTRPLLVDDLAQAMRDGVITFHSKEILDEMLTFIHDDNGNMVALEGYYDDCIFAVGIAFQGFKIMVSEIPTQIDSSVYLPKDYAY